MLGGMAGGLIDPETLQGAQFSGRSIAGSESGLGRAIIFGTTVVEGRLMDGEDEPRVTRADVGKGGPEVENDVALLSYAIEICESSELRGTKVEAVLAVWEDEKLVYDVRENSLVSDADNAKWKKNKQFFYGEEGQMPSAMLQSIHGIGNVPAYVGTCRMDVEDEDLVTHGERIPRYRFLVSRCPVEPPNYLLVTGSAIDEGGPLLAGALAKSPLEFTGIEQSTGATISGGTPALYGRTWFVHSTGGNAGQFSIDNRKTWNAYTADRASFGYLAAGPAGLLVNGQGSYSGYDKLGLAATFGDPVTSLLFATEHPPGTPLRPYGEGNEAYMCRYAGGFYWIDTGAQGELVKTVDLALETQQVIFRRTMEVNHVFLDIEVFGDDVYAALAEGTVRKSSDGGATWPDLVLDIGPGSGMPLYLRSGNGILLILSRDSATVWTSEDGFSVGHSTGISGDTSGDPPVTAAFGRGPMMAYTGENFYIISSTNVLAPAMGDMGVMTADGITFEPPAPLPVKGATGIAASSQFVPTGGGIIIPDAPGYEIDPITGEVVGPDSDIGNACGMYLDEVVREIYRLGSKQLTDDMLDLSALAPYYVRGYALQEVGLTSADGIEPLRRVYFFDLPEYDGKIHARLRAGDIDWTIDPDDIIPGEESTLEGKRGDETKYPKKLQLTYAAISTDYKPTTQTAEDINPDTFTNTEESYQAALVLEDDEAAKVADVMLKVMRIEREDEQKFSLPIQYIGIIASDILSIEGRRYRVDKMRVEKNRVVIERAVRDSQHAYYSEAVGVEGIQRPPPVSSVRGPVASAVMNMPVLRDEDDRAGIYWAGAGYLPGFRGSMLQMSRDGINFENGPELTVSSTMGLLTAVLPAASRYVQDNTNVLRVRMYPGGRDLDSTTFEGLMAEANVAAIVYPDGTTEVIQFQAAVEIADREYELTGLMRGRQDTTPGEHLSGAQFVLLNEDVRFVAIRPDDVGKTLTFRAVSRGTNPEDNATQTVTFTTIESLREWQPYNVVVTADGEGGYCVEWIGRARLGSSRAPAHSQWFLDYRVTFNRAGATYVVDTNEQSVCVSAEDLAQLGGNSTVTVIARSRVATNDDDFDSPPGGPGTPEAPNTGDPMTDPDYYGPDWMESGVALPNGFVGEPYHVNGTGPDSFVWKAGITPNSVAGKGQGSLGANVMARNLQTGPTGEVGLHIYGIPLTAETVASSLHYYSTNSGDSPTDGNVIGSVTFAAQPSFALMDFSERGTAWSYGHIWGGGIDPWCTCYVWNGGWQKSRSEFDTGKVRMEVEATGAMVGSSGSTLIGLVSGPPRTPLYDQLPDTGSCTWPIPTAGIYVVEVDATVNPALVSFRDIAGTLLHSATFNLPTDQVFKFYWYSGENGATIRCNMGNWAWDTPVTSGFGGLPNTSTVVAAQWSRLPSEYAGSISSTGKLGPMLSLSGGSVTPVMSAIGHSTGYHKIGFYDSSRSDIGRIGLCTATTPGQLGTTGDSIGYRNSNISDRNHRLTWTLGGVSGSAVLPAGFGTREEGLIHSRPTWVVFAYNATAAEIEVWIAEESTVGRWRLWTIITGVPADTYYPAMTGTGFVYTDLWHGSPEPAGADPWFITA